MSDRIVSRPASAAYRENWPWIDKHENRRIALASAAIIAVMTPGERRDGFDAAFPECARYRGVFETRAAFNTRAGYEAVVPPPDSEGGETD